MLEPVDRFPISPLIRLTLLSFYGALLLPLPFLAHGIHAAVPLWILAVGVVMGGVGLYGALSQQVIVDAEGIEVTYPGWIRWLFRNGWRLRWQDVVAMKPRSTGQGGIVYYFVGKDPAIAQEPDLSVGTARGLESSGEPHKAYLLPMRIAGFARLTRQIEQQTGMDMTDIKPLAQPWMYGLLLVLTWMLLAMDGWIIWTALRLG